MFEPIVQAIVDQKNAQFELDLSGWFAHRTQDMCLDVLLCGVVVGTIIFGIYNFVTFSLGG